MNAKGRTVRKLLAQVAIYGELPDATGVVVQTISMP